jgi:hypothetical protein
VLVGELLCQIEEHGVTLRCELSKDRLHYSPPRALPPDLVAELKARKEEVIRILREDDEFERTGIIQAERQVFDFAHEYFGKQDPRPKVISLKHKPRPAPATYIYIARRQWCGRELFEASPWANYFSVKRYGREEAIRRYEEKLLNTPELMAQLPELAQKVLVEGKDLACWCAPKGGLTKDDPLHCHGQVLLRLLDEKLPAHKVLDGEIPDELK